MTDCAVVLIIGSAGHALGYHSKPDDTAANSDQIVFLEQCEYVFNIMSPLALGSIKLSILFLYRRIFRGRVFDVLNWILIALVVLWILSFFLVQVFDCRTRFYMNWGPFSELQICLSVFHQLLAFCISDVIIDIFILVLPVPLIWMFHMSFDRKLAITSILLLGTFALVAGILRLVVFAKILEASNTEGGLHILGEIVVDDMASVSLILFWPMIEMGVALVTACLPTLRPLLHGLSESVIQSIRSNLSLSSLGSKARFHQFKFNSPPTSSNHIQNFAFPNEGLKNDIEFEINTSITESRGRSEDQHTLHDIKIQNDLMQSAE